MAHMCSKCSRVNPPEAVYCYYDGVALNGAGGGRGGPVSIGQQAFSSPFTLPSGKVCNNFDQLALGCQNEWKAAVDVLKQGYLEKFLAGQGRADLAMAAREAARFPDKDRGLDQFLAKLPSQAVAPPQLAIEPTEINLGTLKVGDDRKMELKLENRGMRLCYGSVTVENAPWLSLGPTAGTQQKLFQFGSDMTIPVVVQGKKLRASNKPLEAKLVVESNAGDFIVTVKAEVPVKPYPNGCLAGAKSPRQIAEKAKASPKEAADLFEKGAVEKWYKDNGWAYPVRMPAASGLGAVQQFFEALGLTPPPKVEVSERAVALRGDGGQRITHQIEVKAQEKRPVYAHGSSDQSWLEVGKARLNGRVATIPLTVNVPQRGGETLKAKLTVVANGNQKFVIPVTLAVGGAAAAVTLAGPGAPAFEAMIVPAGYDLAPVRVRRHSSPTPVWASLLLALCLFGVAGWDLAATQPPPGPPPFDPPGVVPPDDEALAPIDPDPRIGVSFTPETSRFGIFLRRLRDPKYPEKPKLLTRYDNGLTNNTCVRLDGFEYVYGREVPNLRYHRDRQGVLWKERDVDGNRRKYRSVMDWKNERIRVTQHVEIVVGEATRLYDTCLVKYVVENADNKPHTVGLRVMLDTFIGANDGVPFEVGPAPDAPTHPLVDTMEVFEKGRIPEFIRAVENPANFGSNQTTVAEMGLRLRGFEPIQKVVLCRWPQDQGASEAHWEWKYEPINLLPQAPDSCVVLYWSKVEMGPGEKRALGFTYGLGRIAGEAAGPGGGPVKYHSKMRLFAVPRKVNRPFTVSAYVRGAEGQTVKLQLPPGLELVSTGAEQPVKAEEGKPVAHVSWAVKGSKPGVYKVKATLSDGTTAEENVSVLADSIYD